MSNRMMKSVLTVSILSAMLSVANAAETDKAQQQENESQPQDAVKLETMVLTAEEQVKQSLGVSIITEEDLNKLPVTNDISEYVRRMPGVNLTGNSATGQRGNNRQIDIRGMGPENTLILIDGKPVNSRNSVRYGWRGERDTRGDSNWVPVNAIESIEVLRGPAAARYGSGAMGGVVNIKTEKVTNQLHGSIETYTNQPENSKEGDTNRISVNLSGPIIQDILSYRIYGNYNKTDNDAPDINPVVGSNGYRAAGREGVENKDINARLAWKMTDHQHLFFDIGSGRQGNLYAGDSQNSNLDPTTNDILSQLFGKETNTLYRDNYALTHEGEWSWGDSKLIAQFDRTKNKRLPEGTAGASEGRINSLEDRVTSTLDTLRFNGEVTVPFKLYVPQNLTIGAEWVEDDFSDQENTKQGDGSYGENLTTGDRSKMKSRIASGYLENNMKITDATDMVVGIRFDDHNRSGSNWSPSLNLSHKLGDYFTLKGGIAKAYKAPNLYQNAEGYLLGTRGNGCPIGLSQCVLQGNVNLKPETSINKEIGFEFQKDIVNASLAWFRNDYEDKITSGDEVTQQVVIGDTTYNVLQWTNIPKALIQGLEGSISLDWGDVTWTNNFTYMTDSVNKKTGNPLSVVPNYTINSIFNYDITDAWDVNFIYTQYGRQKPRQYKETSLEDKQGIITESVKSYGLAGINTGYKFNNNF
ncbi:MAG TPA: TonB-dependent siderophore receptor, partial [Acinetobacter radioresistens]|nr:TonB-dependent siderophore receptor [Acinetobacter radioresistens]